MSNWYYKVGQEISGPVSEEEIRYLIILGQIDSETDMSKDDMRTWAIGRKIPQFSHTFSKHAHRQSTSKVDPAVAHAAAPITSRPFPRFCARIIDILLFVQILAALLGVWAILYAPEFFLQVILKYEGLSTLVLLPVAFVLMAVCMTLTGTTPGKAIVGVSVPVPPERNRLWFYLKRELKVWTAGLAVGILIPALYTASAQYRRLVSGRPASYDEGSLPVTANPGKMRVRVATLVAILLSFPTVYFVAEDYVSADALATTHTWVNPETGKTATIGGAWKSEPLNPEIEGVYYFVADELLSEAIFAHETLSSANVDTKTFADAVEEVMANEVVLESDWKSIEVEGVPAMRSTGHSLIDKDADVAITVLVKGQDAWRTLTFSRGGTSDQVAENERFVSAMFSSVP